MLENPLHFLIKPGAVAAWNTRTVVLFSCTASRLRFLVKTITPG
jgi:hypothetical protein